MVMKLSAVQLGLKLHAFFLFKIEWAHTMSSLFSELQADFRPIATVQHKAIRLLQYTLTTKIIILNSIFNDWERIQFKEKHTTRS